MPSFSSTVMSPSVITVKVFSGWAPVKSAMSCDWTSWTELFFDGIHISTAWTPLYSNNRTPWLSDGVSSKRLVNTVDPLSSTTIEKRNWSKRLSCGSGVAVYVAVGIASVIAEIGSGVGLLAGVGEGIAVVVATEVFEVSAGVGITSIIFVVSLSAVTFCGEVAVGGGISGSSEQPKIPVMTADRISMPINLRRVLVCILKCRRFI